MLQSTEDTSGLLQQLKAEDTTVQKPKILQSTEDTSGLLQGTSLTQPKILLRRARVHKVRRGGVAPRARARPQG